MKSSVRVEINAPLEKVARIFADPSTSPQWMSDLERIEPVEGKLGTIGSSYRMIPKKGNMIFLATIIRQNLPNDVAIKLVSPNVDVDVSARISSLGPKLTELVSDEVFTFKGILLSAFSFFAAGAIRKAHRDHIEAFQSFVEKTSS